MATYMYAEDPGLREEMGGATPAGRVARRPAPPVDAQAMYGDLVDFTAGDVELPAASVPDAYRDLVAADEDLVQAQGEAAARDVEATRSAPPFISYQPGTVTTTDPAEEMDIRAEGGRIVQRHEGGTVLTTPREEQRRYEEAGGTISRHRGDVVQLPDAIRGLLSGAVAPEHAPVPESYSPGGVAAGFADTVLAGHADELAANLAPLDVDYDDATAQARQRQRDIAEEHPGSVAGGQVLGVAPHLLLPSPARGLGISRGTGAAARIAQGAIDAGAFGAAYGSGSSEAELGSPEYLRDVGEGGAVSALAGGALAGGGVAAQRAGEAIRPRMQRFAESATDSATMARLRGLFGEDKVGARLWRNMTNSGDPTTARRRLNELQRLGVQTADDAEPVRIAAGDRLQQAAQQIDDLAAQRGATFREDGSPVPPAAVSGARVAERIRAVIPEVRHRVGERGVRAIEREAAE